MRSSRDYEPDAEAFPADTYRVQGYDGIAFYVRGWQVEADEDTEWTGIKERTGMVAVTMVGDDAIHIVDPSDLTPLAREEYCGECGQIGCRHDGLDREEESNSFEELGRQLGTSRPNMRLW